MKLYELLYEAETEESLKRKLADIAQAKKQLTSQGASLGHGGILPHYQSRWNALLAAQRSAQEELKLLRMSKETPEDIAWKRTQSERQHNPELRAQRQSAAIGAGVKHAIDLRDRFGGLGGIASDISKNLNKLTNNKKEPLNLEQLADKYGVTLRTMHKWFEKPEFTKLRAYMPHMYL